MNTLQNLLSQKSVLRGSPILGGPRVKLGEKLKNHKLAMKVANDKSIVLERRKLKAKQYTSKMFLDFWIVLCLLSRFFFLTGVEGRAAALCLSKKNISSVYRRYRDTIKSCILSNVIRSKLENFSQSSFCCNFELVTLKLSNPKVGHVSIRKDYLDIINI